MNQKDIFAALTCQFTSDYTIKDFSAKLAKLFPLIKQLKNLDGYAVNVSGNIGNLELERALPILDIDNYSEGCYYRQAQNKQDNCRELYGQFPNWQKVTFSHASGDYSIYVPVDCKFYSLFMAEIGANVASEAQEIKVLETIELPAIVLDKIGKAEKYVTKDNLRPVMMQVCIVLDGEACEVVATDAHTLYRSEPLKIVNQAERREFLISQTDAKKIAKIKTKESHVKMEILEGDQVRIAGITCKLFTDAKFPDYRVVIPEYKSEMQFERESFIDNVKKVLPFANKCTAQIVLHLNGSISMLTQDVDFCFESSTEMPYISKTFEDTDIAFNGKFLLKAMDTFKKSKIVTMQSEGQPTRAGLFTDGKDTALLMPLMINN